MAPRTWKPLTEEHTEKLVTLVVEAYRMAGRTPSMRRLAAYLIKLAAWRRTADAVDAATGIVIPDAIKYDIRYLPHTAAAAVVFEQYPKELGKRLTHEHSVPLSMLAEKVFSLETDSRVEIRQVFNTYCRAALVTREEDSLLNGAKLRSGMPPGWSFGGGSSAPLTRYAAVGIEILPPSLGWK